MCGGFQIGKLAIFHFGDALCFKRENEDDENTEEEMIIMEELAALEPRPNVGSFLPIVLPCISSPQL